MLSFVCIILFKKLALNKQNGVFRVIIFPKFHNYYKFNIFIK